MPFNIPFLPTLTKSRRSDLSAIGNAIADIYSKLNTEYRSHDVVLNGNVGTSGEIIDLTQISVGVTGSVQDDGSLDIGYRVGDSILLKSAFIKGNVGADPNATSATPIKLTLFRHYPQFTGDAPLDTELYDEATITSSGDRPFRLQNLRYTKQYKILATREFSLSDNVDSDSNQRFEFFKQWNRSHVEWHGSSGTSASHGKLYLHMMGSKNATPAGFTVTSRVRYIDN